MAELATIEAAAAPDSFRPATPGESVAYTTEYGEVVEAVVVAAHGRGDVVDLAYRPDGSSPKEIREGVSWRPDLALHWARPGEKPPVARESLPGGRPIVQGAIVCFHEARTDLNDTERHSVVHGRIVEVMDGNRFRVEFGGDDTGRWGRVLECSKYSGERFRRGRWSWPADGVQAPPPRSRPAPAERMVRCPISGESVRANRAVPVSIGGRSADWATADALLSNRGAELLRQFFKGESKSLQAKPAPKMLD